MSDSILQVNHLSKSFGKNVVLRDIDFSVKKGDVTSIIGASGSGKSTLLRCINLLEIPTAGQILFHEQDIMQRGYDIPAYRAKVGMVFQSFNLFNNMTVLDNCMIGLRKVMHKDRDIAEQTARFYLDKVGMLPYIHAKPRQISGGQKQRVAIALALACDPDILLADEPTTALDVVVQQDIMNAIADLAAGRSPHGARPMGVLLVTHDLPLALSRADRVNVMYRGQIVERGAPQEILQTPKHGHTRALLDGSLAALPERPDAEAGR